MELFDEQYDHVRRLDVIFEKSHVALDFSIMGSGKTYTSTYLAMRKGYTNVMVIAPNVVLPKWHMMNELYQYKFKYVMSYNAIRSKHNGIIVNDAISDNIVIDFLIIDEMQNIKNINIQHNVCKMLIAHVQKSGGKILMLSGSPFDKKEHLINIMTLCGIITNKLSQFSRATGNYEWLGFKEFLNFIKKFNNNILPARTLPELKDSKPEKLVNVIYDIFQSTLRDSIVSAMSPLKLNAKIYKYNGFFNISLNEDNIKLNNKMIELRNIKEESDNNKNNVCMIAQIQKILYYIEVHKLNEMMLFARMQLNNRRKVVICLNYTESIHIMQDLMSDVKGIQLLYGLIPNNLRQTIINNFQLPTFEYPLLICNLNLCSTGIDLDDKSGKFPRVCIVNPNYNTINLYQLSHRFYRRGTLSDAYIYMFFTKDRSEIHILNSLATKSNVMKDISTEQTAGGVQFLCDYEDINMC
jgi:hypothetical protein